MGTKASRFPTGKPDPGPMPWVPAPVTPLPDVYELYGADAESAWAAAWLNQYLDDDERAFAGTAPAPLM